MVGAQCGSAAPGRTVTMTDSRDEADFDVRQRYGLLERVLSSLATDLALERPSVLDVGAGVDRLLARVVPPDLAITPADAFDIDEHVVPLVPGEPLPFDDASYDVVIAMDVLEHLPENERDTFLSELSRVARHAVVVACPCYSAETKETEERVLDVMHRALGPHRMLEEHEQHGLPDRERVAATLAATNAAVVQLPNIPLATW